MVNLTDQEQYDLAVELSEEMFKTVEPVMAPDLTAWVLDLMRCSEPERALTHLAPEYVRQGLELPENIRDAVGIFDDLLDQYIDETKQELAQA